MSKPISLSSNSPEFSGDKLIPETQLADRWGVSPRTLQAQRLRGSGCPFIVIGRNVRYRLSDVITFEEQNRLRSTSERGR